MSPPSLPAEPTEVEIVDSIFKYYRDTPVEAIDYLKTIWRDYKGSRNELAWSELIAMVYALALSLHGIPGHPKDEGDLLKACISERIPLFALELIKDRDFINRNTDWINIVLLLNSYVLSAWLPYVLRRLRNARRNLPDPDDNEPWHIQLSLAEHYFQAIGPVWDVLWSNQALFLSDEFGPGLAGEMLTFTCNFISFHSVLLPERVHERVKDYKSIIGVALGCWMSAATTSHPDAQLPPGQHSGPFKVVRYYAHCVRNTISVEGLAGDNAYLWRNAVDKALDGIGPLKFMRLCASALSSWPYMVGSNLQFMSETLDYIAGWHPDLEGDVEKESAALSSSRRAFWDVPVVSAAAEALERQYSATVNPSKSLYAAGETVSVCLNVTNLLKAIQEGFVCRPENTPVADGSSVYRIFSRCLLLLCYVLKSTDETDVQFREFAVSRLEAACISWEQMFGDDSGTQTSLHTIASRRVRKGIIAAAQKQWYTDLYTLRSHRIALSGNKHYDALVSCWIHFGGAWGLDDVAERDRHASKHKHHCSWANCKYHTQPFPAALSTCTGCGEQKYCSRSCQIKDWKQGGHREKCRRISTA